ncbi:MAG TPA: nitroreductase family protein, partial [Chloroflexi bacterium]|jgi:nitroreductase|nr:nitroreductase family protein [Chloroflexota bacterium]
MPVLKIDNLFARRSIRRFTDEPVTPEQVTLLLQAAMAAPSAGNRRPWHFIVVTDAGTRAALAASHPHARMLTEAPVCIIPCGDPALSFADRSEFWIQDVSAATENILLAATGLGLGSVWCGVYPVPERMAEAREILEIPEHIIPFAYLAIGHGAEEKEPRTQYDAERVHWGRW